MSKNLKKNCQKYSSKNSSKVKKIVKKIHQKNRSQGHQGNNELYLIYKSGPFVPGQSRFLEASLVRKRTASLKNPGIFRNIAMLHG